MRMQIERLQVCHVQIVHIVVEDKLSNDYVLE